MTTSNITLDSATLHATVPFAGTLAIRLADATPDEVQLDLEWSEELCTAGGALHGGVMMSLADTAGAVAAFLNLPEGAQGTTTIESKTNLLAAVTGGSVMATARPIHTGGSFIVVETELRNGDELVAKTIQTQAVLR